jgi:hypothetical protein
MPEPLYPPAAAVHAKAADFIALRTTPELAADVTRQPASP